MIVLPLLSYRRFVFKYIFGFVCAPYTTRHAR